jgi:hypothetical protein
MEISFKTKEMTEARKVEYPMPETFDGLVEKFGTDAVYEAATGAFVISLQALGRRNIGKTDEDIQELALSWNPNERSPAVKQTAFEKASNALRNLSPEEKAALIAKLTGG